MNGAEVVEAMSQPSAACCRVCGGAGCETHMIYLGTLQEHPVDKTEIWKQDWEYFKDLIHHGYAQESRAMTKNQFTSDHSYYWICAYQFDDEDPRQKGYSMSEVDMYAWIPFNHGEQHRLSLRKNLTTGEYEAYRRYTRRVGLGLPRVYIESSEDRGIEEIAFKSKHLTEVIDFCNQEYERHHGKHTTPDAPCTHEFPNARHDCPEAMKKRAVALENRIRTQIAQGEQ